MASNLSKKMEITREQMIQSGIDHGLQNLKTIRLSRKLDKLINLYNQEQNPQLNKTTLFINTSNIN